VFRAVVLLLALTGCRRPPDVDPAKETEVVVFAATSLGDVFARMSEAFRRTRPGVTVRFNFAGTQQLRTQLEHGAAADVFASADMIHMQALRRSGTVGSSVVFARNEPVLVVSLDRASAIAGLQDLPSALRVVIGVPEVPIGRYTLDILDRASMKYGEDFRARVEAKVVSRELNVRQVLSRVTLGEADAGIVYRTDATSAEGKVAIKTIPPELNAIASYPIATIVKAKHPALANAWMAFVLSGDGQGILKLAGFHPGSGAAAP